MKIVLFTTCIVSEKSLSDLDRLVASIRDSQLESPVIHYILLQGGDFLAAEQVRFLETDSIVLQTISSTVSLSAARNIMLDQALDQINEDDLVAFPDDDAWYPQNVLARITAMFRTQSELDMVFCRYGMTAVDRADSECRVANVKAVVRNASSNTIFLRGIVARSVGRFHQNLGVGTPNNGGEDIDYALRAFAMSRLSIFIPEKIVGHRDKFNGLRAKYFIGNALALRNNSLRGPSFMIEYLRKLLIGIYLVAKRELPPSEFIRALTKTI